MNSLMKKHRISCCFALLSCCLVPAPLRAAGSTDPVSFVQTGFEGLKHGTFGDAGANTYLSAKGKIQTIHRWDLNRDGEIDLLFTQDHNSDYAPDSMIYWGGPDGPESYLPELPRQRSPYTLLKYSEQARKRMTWLPSMGGGRCVIADLNNDSYPDILFGNTMHNFRQDMPAYIYWGSAQGYREVDRTILPGYTVSGVAVGDLNEDGLPDVVLANQGFERAFEARFGPMINNLESYVYWGHATGFDASRRLSLPTISAADVAVGDFNGDKHLDIAFANSDGKAQTLYVYWGDGTGKFGESSRQMLSVGGEKPAAEAKEIEMFALLASDLNRDGLTDLVVAGNRVALVFSGSKSGLNPSRTAELPAENCNGVEAADLNGDGEIDLVLANTGNSKQPPASTIYWGDRNGYRADRRATLPTLGAKTVKAGDLNRDGFPDLLFGNEGSGTPSHIFWGSANGFSGFNRKELQGFGVVGAGLADLDRDGNLDVVLMNHLSGGSDLPSPIYWGNKEHFYSTASASFLEPGGAMMQTVADFDDDGFPDIVMVDDGVPFVWWGTPAGFNAQNRTELPLKSVPSGDNIGGLGVADLDRDGHLDLVCIGRTHKDPKLKTGPKAIILYGNDRRFAGARTAELQLSGHRRTQGAIALTIADLNRDGYLELIIPLLDIGIGEIWWGGAKGFDQEKVTKFETNGASHAAVADLDGDQWLDVIFISGLRGRKKPDQVIVGGTGIKGTTRNSETQIWWGSPDGFKTRSELESYNVLDATVADFNRDGHLDIALTNYLSDTTRELPAMIFWGDGTRAGFNNHRRTFLDAASSSAIDALDLNRDGWLDLVVTNHQRNFSHLSGTNIYWGGEKGYSNSRRINLPTIGAHLDTMVDSGNIDTRKYEWDYISAPIEVAKDMEFTALKWKAATELGTGVKFQVRGAATENDLARAAWSGPQGPGSFYTASGTALAEATAQQRWLQYRAVLTSPDGANSAVLSEVEIICAHR